MELKYDYKKLIRDVPNFPKPPIIFKDVTTVLKVPDYYRALIDDLVKAADEFDYNCVVGIEARGFIFAAPIAYASGASFVPIRKKGKLPAEVIREEYELEYGTDVIEIHKDAFDVTNKVLLVDDVLATGGTAKAAIDLIRKAGGEVVGALFFVELEFLKGREKLDVPVKSLVVYRE